MSIRCAAIVLVAFILSCDSSAVTRFLDVAQNGHISVAVTGLLGQGLKITLRSETLALSSNGNFTFSTRVRLADSLALQVTEFPGSPRQYCARSSPATVDRSEIVATVTCGPGSAAGPMVAGTIIKPLALKGDVDVSLGEVFAGSIG